MDTLIGEAVVVFRINRVCGAKEGFSSYDGSGCSSMDGQRPPCRIFPEAKDMLRRKGQIIGVFPP
jgi:hypothetical protein